MKPILVLATILSASVSWAASVSYDCVLFNIGASIAREEFPVGSRRARMRKPLRTGETDVVVNPASPMTVLTPIGKDEYTFQFSTRLLPNELHRSVKLAFGVPNGRYRLTPRGEIELTIGTETMRFRSHITLLISSDSIFLETLGPDGRWNHRDIRTDHFSQLTGKIRGERGKAYFHFTSWPIDSTKDTGQIYCEVK